MSAGRRRGIHPQEGERYEIAIPRKGEVGVGQLDESDGNTVTISHGGLLDGSPGLCRPQTAADFPGKAELERRAKTERVEHFPHFLWRKTQGNLCRTDVGGFLDDLGYREHTVDMGIMNGGIADGKIARGRLNRGVWPVFPFFQAKPDCKRLHGRAGFESVCQGTITQRSAHEARPVVRVVGREVDQGQDFTRLGVQNDDTTASGLVIDHGLTQIAVSQILNF